MMFRRVFPHPLLTLILWAIWLLLNNSMDPGHIVLGAALAIFIPWLTSSYWPEQIIIRHPWMLVLYILKVLYEILVANAVVAKLILGPQKRLNPGFLHYELQLTSPVGISLLANTISLTPGTVSCDLSKDRRYLLIHALHIDDVAEIKAEIHRKFEKPLLEIFVAC
ncbi:MULTISPECIES: Na+/H+ antiporter subunit E [unclassified Methylophaga]|jgi:multicomponent K+:H+ antiporter subunit E|uniref:Na+/H+ antiporter subunit E n=1 Tax=unclassified Methylophaga TaxID=2629249 RepID=UPI000C8AAAE0|nr:MULTISPECIES: Na+/H+ antiporter subunit E [unclassified Methylophaga]MAK65973.1 Na+/H+ antiporter subunit E [Methylophaga sp.]MAY18650.1 Na+/H+ antiporter subunit E [Methylophaga sp.]MBN46416.1 Na+/H+ antiporter subunit E [Methylophaga sp.]HAO26073.1 Na+/H+ antiporter subunit E [Methylophaga sp.]|tara:strand:+ start:33671 stop:34168 length:498 start_codon:yes stop_codon:yes gene_type:complete